MDTQFAKFLKIGIVVEDVEESVGHYEEYGMGPWTVNRLDSDKLPGTFTMNGKEDRLELILASCQCWGFEVELIQPVSEGPFMDYLREHGPGIHHIAVVTRDSFQDVLTEHRQRTGRDPWCWCKAPEIGLEFSYLDLHRELGIFLEVYNEDKHGGLPADFEVAER